MLINLQPFARPINLEVRLGDEREPAGTALDCAEKLVSMKGSLLALAASITDGLFALRDEMHWQFEMRYPTSAEWQDFIDRPSFGGVEADQELIDAALERPDGCVVSTEDDLAQSYERLVCNHPGAGF